MRGRRHRSRRNGRTPSALAAASHLDDDRGKLYADVVLGFINEAARRALEAEMRPGSYTFDSPYINQKIAEARVEGVIEARLATLARAVLTVLDARGLAIADDQRDTIVRCTDPDELEAWLQRAATIAHTDDLFG